MRGLKSLVGVALFVLLLASESLALVISPTEVSLKGGEKRRVFLFNEGDTPLRVYARPLDPAVSLDVSDFPALYTTSGYTLNAGSVAYFDVLWSGDVPSSPKEAAVFYVPTTGGGGGEERVRLNPEIEPLPLSVDVSSTGPLSRKLVLTNYSPSPLSLRLAVYGSVSGVLDRQALLVPGLRSEEVTLTLASPGSCLVEIADVSGTRSPLTIPVSIAAPEGKIVLHPSSQTVTGNSAVFSLLNGSPFSFRVRLSVVGSSQATLSDSTLALAPYETKNFTVSASGSGSFDVLATVEETGEVLRGSVSFVPPTPPTSVSITSPSVVQVAVGEETTVILGVRLDNATFDQVQNVSFFSTGDLVEIKGAPSNITSNVALRVRGKKVGTGFIGFTCNFGVAQVSLAVSPRRDGALSEEEDLSNNMALVEKLDASSRTRGIYRSPSVIATGEEAAVSFDVSGLQFKIGTVFFGQYGSPPPRLLSKRGTFAVVNPPLNVKDGGDYDMNPTSGEISVIAAWVGKESESDGASGDEGSSSYVQGGCSTGYLPVLPLLGVMGLCCASFFSRRSS